MAKMTPTDIALHQKSRILELTWPDGVVHKLPLEYLRVYSPSAEVRGHGPGQETLQLDKQNVNIKDIEPIGHYAVKLGFDDGHDSGLYDWGLLHDLGENHREYWDDYLARCEAAGHKREVFSEDTAKENTADKVSQANMQSTVQTYKPS